MLPKDTPQTTNRRRLASFDARCILIFVIALFRAFVLSYFLATLGLDLHFLTYISYTLVTGFYILALAFSNDLVILSYILLFFLPLVFSLILFIDVAIIIIVQLNDWVFTKSTVIYKGTRTVGDVHTGDWLLHYLPAIEILLLVAFYSDLLRLAYAQYAKITSKGELLIYKFYIHLVGVVIILIYCVTMNFQQNYPINGALSTAVVIVISCAVAVLVGFLFYCLLALPTSSIQENSLSSLRIGLGMFASLYSNARVKTSKSSA
jgi:hypothetical protein